MGAAIGYIARKILKYARQHNMVDHESFLSYGIGLAFLCLGIVGVIGSDDILAAFVAGNSFTWDDYFRIETEDHAFQDVIDVLLDSAIFIFIGTLIPWSAMGDAALQLQPWRLVVITILILLFRRIPAVMALYKLIPLADWKEALFVGHVSLASPLSCSS
jgi:NhaP-type Na+/H+ or K+/H+ antiporter